MKLWRMFPYVLRAQRVSIAYYDRITVHFSTLYRRKHKVFLEFPVPYPALFKIFTNYQLLIWFCADYSPAIARLHDASC